MPADYNPNDPQLIWRKGFPPHTGWWNASVCKEDSSWRWFDKPARTWSQALKTEESATIAGHWARIPNRTPSCLVEWRTYYPANARVPRSNPGANA